MVKNTYRRDRSYLWNYRHGPSFAGPYPRLPSIPGKELLGFKVRSRIGIAAGILLNSRWMECYSRLGFDILTYKTVRSAHRPCYPLPNWVYLAPPRSGPGLVQEGAKMVLAGGGHSRPREVTSAVCFGMPSMAPEVWRADVRKARRLIRRGQLLIVSVVGTPLPGGGQESLVEDFVRCARWAAAAGAHAVEANFSCPNVCTPEGSVYQDPDFSGRLSRDLRDALPSTPLLIKAGHFNAEGRLRAFYRAVSPWADGIVLVNGISARVLTPAGRPVFRGHERVGVLGRAIHKPAVRAVRSAAAMARRAGWRTATLAVGGVLGEEDAADFFAAGAAGVLLGGGAALDPYLAVRMQRAHPEW